MSENELRAARRTAHHICSLLHDFIPERCQRDALDHVTEACFREGLEFTSTQMRKQYESRTENLFSAKLPP